MRDRFFLIVDDKPDLAENVRGIVEKYYRDKKDYSYNIKCLGGEGVFNEATAFIKNNYRKIDVIFTDQKLNPGLGTDLFKFSQTFSETSRYPDIRFLTRIYRVLHSDKDTRLKETQSERVRDWFVNSKSPKDIKAFLDMYELNILAIKRDGNRSFTNRLHSDSYSKKQINVNQQVLSISDILFLIMDKDTGNSDHYYFFYNNGSRIIQSGRSIRPSEKVISLFKDFDFVNGKLKSGRSEIIKANPYWISEYDANSDTLKLFSPYNTQINILVSGIEKAKVDRLINVIDPYFLEP